jgi:hypothetical protein
LCAFVVAVPLHAQSPQLAPSDPALAQQQTEQARVLFNEGLQFVEHEDWVQAESRFRSVLMLKSSQVVAYNLASALTHLGRYMEAAELLRAVVRDPAVEASTRDAAQQLLSETEPKIGVLTLRVSGDMQGARVQLDGTALELSEQILTISVDPGEHHVVVERDGGVVASETVQVGGASPLQAELTLALPARIAPNAVAKAAHPAQPRASDASAVGPAAPPVTAPDEPRDDEGGGSILGEWWLWAAVGTVAVGGAVAGVLIASRGPADPVSGDTSPAVVRGTVKVQMP